MFVVSTRTNGNKPHTVGFETLDDAEECMFGIHDSLIEEYEEMSSRVYDKRAVLKGMGVIVQIEITYDEDYEEDE